MYLIAAGSAVYQDVGFGKASNATCYNAGNPRNAVAPQPTIFLQHFSLDTPLQNYELRIK
ncbi:hypothetical protein [Nostoc sp.]